MNVINVKVKTILSLFHNIDSRCIFKDKARGDK